MKTVLFLCTGNYYRSRFAEIYFNWHARELQAGWRADSRGLRIDPANPGPMSRYTIEYLTALAIPHEEHLRLPQSLTVEDLKTADHVVAVKRTEHHPLMQSDFPDWLERVEYWEVHDIDCAVPDEAMPHLKQEVHALLERLKGR